MGIDSGGSGRRTLSIKKMTFVDAVCRVQAAITDKAAIPYLKAQAQSGWLTCWRVGDCTMLIRPEDSELVVVAAEGKNLLPAVAATIEAAKVEGFETIRFHTKRKGLRRLLSHLPFTTRPACGETIYILEL